MQNIQKLNLALGPQTLVSNSSHHPLLCTVIGGINGIFFSPFEGTRGEINQIFRISVIGNLLFVGLGSILLCLLAWSAHRQKMGPNAIQPLIGAILLGYHCIINDAIIWNVMYPW